MLPADEALWTYQSRFVRTARPDQDGRFQMQGLPPFDRYLAVPVQGLEDGQAGDPEFLNRIRSQGVSFSLNEGEARLTSIEVQLAAVGHQISALSALGFRPSQVRAEPC